MKKKLLLAICCFSLGIGIYQVLPRTTYMNVNESTAYMSLEEMVCKADLIVEGTVGTSQASQWDRTETGEPMDTIHTDVSVHTVDLVLGEDLKKRSSILVRTNVGQIENTIQTSTSYPTLEDGEQVLLFLCETSDSTAPYTILGSSQGKFIRTEDGGIPVYSNGRDSIPVAELEETIQNIALEYADTEWSSDYYTPEEIKEMNDALFNVEQ